MEEDFWPSNVRAREWRFKNDRIQTGEQS